MTNKKLVIATRWLQLTALIFCAAIAYYIPKGEEKLFYNYMSGVLTGIAYFALVGALTATFPKLRTNAQKSSEI